MLDFQKFGYKLAGFLSIQFIFLLGVLLLYILNHEEAAEQGYMAATIDKHAMLLHQPKPRVIFVGGSNLAFGINSPYIGKQLNYHPVNMGLHAGLGLEFMLREVENSLQAGDIVVVSLEYQHFVDNRPAKPEFVLGAVDNRVDNIRFLPLYYIPSLLDKGLIYAGGILRNSINASIGDIELNRVYRRSSFDKFGDISVNQFSERQDLSNADIGVKLDVSPHTIQRTVRRLNSFNKYSQAKRVRVFYSYPPLLKRLFDENTSAITAIESELTQNLELQILDRPKDLAWPNDDFFDTEYHLNRVGVEKRSRHIANKLSEHLNRD